MAALNPKRCLGCSVVFRPKTNATKYHDAACAKAAKKKTKINKRLESFPSTSFGKWLIYNLREAGTVEALSGVDLEALYALWKQRRHHNGYGHGLEQKELFQLSHIAPCKGRDVVGLLCPDNLIIAPARYNNARQTRWDGVSGRYVRRTSLKRGMLISEGESTESVLKKVKKLLGGSFESFLDRHTLSLTASAQMAKKLNKAGCKEANADMSYEHLKSLMDETFPADDDEEGGYVIRPLQPSSEWAVFESECQRMGAALPDSYDYTGSPDWDYLHSEFEPGMWVEGKATGLPVIVIDDAHFDEPAIYRSWVNVRVYNPEIHRVPEPQPRYQDWPESPF